jgi:hypothetical protein
MRRHELTDAQWELIADLMPRPGRRSGARWRDHRQVVNGLMWKLATRSPMARPPRSLWPMADSRRALQPVATRWADGPAPGPPAAHANAEVLIDLDLWCIDSASIRASRSAAGARKGGSRGTGAPRPWPFARGHRHQDPPGCRQCRPAARLHVHPWAAARDVCLRANVGDRAPACPSGAAPRSSQALGRR